MNFPFDFLSRNINYDIGLIRLRKPFNLAAMGAAPTCLLQTDFHDFGMNQRLVTAGHGLTEPEYVRRYPTGRMKRQPTDFIEAEIPEPVLTKGSNHLMATNVFQKVFKNMEGGAQETPKVQQPWKNLVRDICSDSTDNSFTYCGMSFTSTACPGDSGGKHPFSQRR